MSMHTFHPEPIESEPSAGAQTSSVFTQARQRLESRDRPVRSIELLPAAAITKLSRPDHPVHRYYSERNARPHSMASYRTKLRKTARLLVESGFEDGIGLCDDHEAMFCFPWHRVMPQHAHAFYALLCSRYENVKTRSNLVGALRELVRLCSRAHLITLAHRELVLDALPVRAEPQRRVGREITDDEFVALLEAAATYSSAPPVAARDVALLAVFWCTGTRLSEVVDLDLGDYDPVQRSLHLDRTKSGRSRTAWLADDAADLLDEWIDLRGDRPGPLFSNEKGNRYTPPGLAYRIATLGRAAGLAHRLSSHNFRRTMITRLLRAGVDPFVVARTVGHVRVTTTMVYDHRTETEDRAVVAHLSLPSADNGRRDR
jgi:integrase